MADERKILCRAPGDRCHGCAHYHGKADVCEHTPTPAPEGDDAGLVERLGRRPCNCRPSIAPTSGSVEAIFLESHEPDCTYRVAREATHRLEHLAVVREVAVARIEALTAQLEETRRLLGEAGDRLIRDGDLMDKRVAWEAADREEARATRAEADAERLREALERIANETGVGHGIKARDIARAALAHREAGSGGEDHG